MDNHPSWLVTSLCMESTQGFLLFHGYHPCHHQEFYLVLIIKDNILILLTSIKLGNSVNKDPYILLTLDCHHMDNNMPIHHILPIKEDNPMVMSHHIQVNLKSESVSGSQSCHHNRGLCIQHNLCKLSQLFRPNLS